ncbi:transcriptional regulator, partial [Archaeoglobales archaeon]
VVKKGWIGYVYMAENPITVLRKLKSKIIKEIENLEKMLE